MSDPVGTVELILPNRDNIELLVTKQAEEVAASIHLDKDKTADLTMALIEACINAFEHGQSADDKVHVKFVPGEDALRVEIQDRGRGFDQSKVEEPDIRKKVEQDDRKRGWGLHLMKKLADDVAIESSPHGTKITLTKYK